MHIGHWLGVAFVLYEGVVGISEIYSASASTPNASLAGVANWPSVGSVVGSTGSNTTAGAIDLAAAAAVYFFVLHDHLFS
jgi:hypothetical protein